MADDLPPQQNGEEPDKLTNDLQHLQLALQQSQERYQVIVESVKEYAMFTMDAAARIDSWNQGARRIMGYEASEAIGLPGAIIFTPEDRAAGEVEAELARARQNGQAINERWHLRKDGSRFWGSGVVTSLWDGRRLRGYAKVMRDNTRRKQAEEDLRQSQERLRALNETLEERVQQRTQQVRTLASELVISEQKVRHRISQVLHDNLQQLLYGLEMQLHFLRQDMSGAAPERDATLEQMAAMIQESLRLTRQLTVELSPPVLHGEGLLEALEWLSKYMRDIYGLEIAVSASNHPRVADEDQRILLFQVVRELLFNVVKHAGVTEAHVTLQEEQGGITIVVEDQGKGFDVAQALAHHPSYGLNNVRERLHLFGGRFDVRSQPGAGTQVTLYLPHQPGNEQEGTL